MTASTALSCSFTIEDHALDAMGDAGEVWRNLVAANQPVRRRAAPRIYRVVTHAGADQERGERVAIEWLRSLLYAAEAPEE